MIKSDRLLLISRFASYFGDGIYFITISWYIIEVYKSLIVLGSVSAISAIPNIILIPIIGVMIDKYIKKHIVLSAYLIRICLIFIMIIAMITKTFSIVILYPINIIIGVCESIYSIGYNGLASENIEKKSLTKFFSNMTVMYQAGYLLGSMSAGFIIGAIGVRGALMIDAAAYIAALICISNIPKRIKNASVTVSIRTEIINYLKSIKEGAIFLSHSRGLISIIVLSMPVMIFISLINIIEPAFVQEILKGTEIDFGFVDAALGVGAIIGSFILKYFSSKHKELKFLWLGYLLMACGMMLFGMSQSLFFAILANGLIGVTYTMSLVVYQAILQNASDENYIGRVISSQKLLQNLCASVSLLLIGYLGAIVNYRILVIILASFYFIISFLSFFGLKKMTMPFIQ